MLVVPKPPEAIPIVVLPKPVVGAPVSPADQAARMGAKVLYVLSSPTNLLIAAGLVAGAFYLWRKR